MYVYVCMCMYVCVPWSGVPTVDYFVSISEEVPDAQRGYSERLHRMSSGPGPSSSPGAAAVLGSQFADRHRDLFLLHLRQPRTVLLDRSGCSH